MSQLERSHDVAGSWNLDKIYEKYDGFIQSIIEFVAKNPADCEDIYHEVFLVLFQMDSFSEISDIKSYLYRLVVNKANEYSRKKIFGELELKKYQQHVHQKEENKQKQDFLARDEIDKIVSLIHDQYKRSK